MAIYFRGVGRAATLLIIAILVALFANDLTDRFLQGQLSEQRLGNYIYFSFFNQLPIFALGNLLYYIAYRNVVSGTQCDHASEPSPFAAVGSALVMLAIAAYLPLPRSFSLSEPGIPNFFFCALWMSLLIYGLAFESVSWLTSAPVAAMGKVSFSAYLWHWLVLSTICDSWWGETLTSQCRYAAVAAYVVLFLLTAATTYVIAAVTYQLVEKVGVAASKSIILRRQIRCSA